MTNLTDKQKELLSNPDVKDLILEFANWQIMGMDKEMLGIQLDAFASQFEPEWKILSHKSIYDGVHIVNENCTKYKCDIHSVQYKSETLTVDDETNYGVIRSFEVQNSTMYVLCKSDFQYNSIDMIKKIERKPRFVTNWEWRGNICD